jgi:hypothetical protein
LGNVLGLLTQQLWFEFAYSHVLKFINVCSIGG